MDNNEVLCGCFNVTLGDIKGAIDKGAKSFEEIQEVTKVGTGCGECKETVMEIVESLLK